MILRQYLAGWARVAEQRSTRGNYKAIFDQLGINEVLDPKRVNVAIQRHKQ